MDASFQQFALLDMLLENWDGVRVRMGEVPASLDAELARVAAQLAASQQPGQVAIALDQLLDLIEDTAAYAYVQQLIRRCTFPMSAITRGAIGEQVTAAFAAPGVMQASNALAAAAAAAPELQQVPIFFVTNRKGDAAQPLEQRYTGDCAQEVAYGRALVTIPKRSHRVGHVERPLPLIGRERADRHVVIAEEGHFNRDGFATSLAHDLASAQRKELLIFLHGYRVTFEEAARRAAQVANDIGFGGVVVLFSWPSAGTLLAYFADEDSAAKSAAPLRALLRDLEGGPWSCVHLLAHSMGSRVMVSSLSGPEVGWTLPIQNVVLVAADLDVELFQQQFPSLRARVRQDAGGLVTSYTSSADRALGVSSWFHRGTRLGRVGDRPLPVAGLETVDATATDSSLLGLHHGYFAEQRSLLTDLGLLLREGLPAVRRGLQNVQDQWWAFPR
jgi:esterase/lipase superfamily enzyme